MAGTWLDFALRYHPCGCPRKDPIVFDLIGRKRGGRHWTRTSDLLHVKQERASETSAANAVGRSGVADRRSGAAARLDFGWTA